MLARDELMWSDRLGLKGETKDGEVANSTACAAVFACTPQPMVQKNGMLRQSADEHSTCTRNS